MSVPHSDITVLNSEMSDFEGNLMTNYSAKVDNYMKIAPVSGFSADLRQVSTACGSRRVLYSKFSQSAQTDSMSLRQQTEDFSPRRQPGELIGNKRKSLRQQTTDTCS
jgi:hypothetical protein